MKSTAYLVFLRNDENGCLRISVSGDPYECARRTSETSGCSIQIIYEIGFPTIEDAIARKDVLLSALSAYKKNYCVNGKCRSQFSSWFYPEAWEHFYFDEVELEEAIEELYQYYDGKSWILEDSFPV